MTNNLFLISFYDFRCSSIYKWLLVDIIRLHRVEFWPIIISYWENFCNRLNLVTTTRMSRRGDAQRERKKLRVQGYTGRSRIGQVDQRWIASKVLRRYLPKGGLRTKPCDDVCPRVVCKRSPAMMFAQGWIVSKVLWWCLTKGGLRTKSCDDDCPRVARQMAKGRLCDDT